MAFGHQRRVLHRRANPRDVSDEGAVATAVHFDHTGVRVVSAHVDAVDSAAVGAGRVSAEALGGPVDLALLISCVGRRMVLRQRVEEEVEGVRDIVGPDATIAGFYSYGEISPFTPKARCELHNQTTTVTTLSER